MKGKFDVPLLNIERKMKVKRFAAYDIHVTLLVIMMEVAALAAHIF